MRKEPAKSYPLSWPEGWKRTAENEKRNLNSKMNAAKAASTVFAAIHALGGKDIVLSTNIPVRNDGLPFGSGGEPSDRGAAVYFKLRGEPVTMACDRFFWVSQNIRALALSIECIRGLERYGASELMQRAFKGFTALPEKAGEYWRDVLDIPEDAKPTPEDIEKAFRASIQKAPSRK